MTSLGETYEIHKIVCKSGPSMTYMHCVTSSYKLTNDGAWVLTE